jgi:TolB-like protein/DNA-binding SARP family transcriptional activator/Tfp pilus assembly protein PilF
MSSLRLNILGRFDARLSSGEVLLLPTRKAEVLLTYLSMTPGQPHSRDRLMNLLWSDRGEDQARNSLRQTLSVLKKALEVIDPLPLQVDRTTVSVLAESIEMDTFELENSNATTDAINLYRGEFLEGIVVRDPSGEEWLTSERDRYRRMAVEALEKLLTRQRETGEMGAAVETGERLVGLEPLRESAWRQLMLVYATRGERGQALKAYTRCTDILEKEFGIEPEQETIELQTAIHDGRFDIAVTDSHPEPMILTDHAPAVTAGLPVPASSGKPSIVVLPFVCLGTESSDEYFTDGLTEDIIANLCRYRELFVIAHESAFAYRDSGANAEHSVSQIGVEYVTKGNIRRSGDQIRISIHLIEAATGKTVWAERIDRKFDELFSLEDEVAARIASTLVSHIEDESNARAARKHPGNMTAFDCVMRARKGADSFDAEQNTSARQLLEQAIELDPEYAAAYAYLAYSYCVEAESAWCLSRQEADENAVAHARKAVALDEFDSDGHVGLGWAYLHQKKFDLAEVHLDRAIECNPNDYAAFCVKSWLLSLSGRASEVTICGTTALRLNPLAPDNCLLAIIIAHYTENRYDEALGMLARVQEASADSEAWRAACLAQLGRDDESQVAAASAVKMGGDFIKSQDWLLLWPFKDPQDLKHFIDGLNKSGVLKDSAGKPGKFSGPAGEPMEGRIEPPDKPSIAVLPFQNMSSDPEQEYLVDGITDDIITNLSRFRDLFVIASNSSFVYKGKAVNVQDVSRELGVRYILEGSVQKSKDEIKINAQLIDGSTGSHLWAERYQRHVDDIFALQDEVVGLIVGSLATGYGGRLRKAWQRQGSENPRAFDAFMRGMDLMDNFTKADNSRARELFEEAIRLNPNYGKAYAKLAWAYILDATEGWRDNYEDLMAKAMEAATRGVELEDEESWVHWSLGACHFYAMQHDLGLAEFERAIELNPNDADVLADAGFYFTYAGKAEEGAELIYQAMRINPHYPEYYLVQLGQVLFDAHNYDEAIATFARLRNVETPISCLYLAASQAALGNIDKAKEAIDRVLKHDPDATTEKWTQPRMTPYINP